MLCSTLKSLRRAPIVQPASERSLHIGGTVRNKGWEVFNARPGSAVDHLGAARDIGLNVVPSRPPVSDPRT